MVHMLQTLIQELSALMNREARIDEIRDIIHIHPTLSEILQDAPLINRYL